MASRTARLRANILERLASDLRRGATHDPDGDDRIAAVLEALSIGQRGEIDVNGLKTLRRLKVPRALVPLRVVTYQS